VGSVFNPREVEIVDIARVKAGLTVHKVEPVCGTCVCVSLCLCVCVCVCVCV